MLITKNINEILNQKMTPFAILPDEDIIGLNYQEMSGNMLLLGKTGQGKSVFIENIISSNLKENKSGLLIDPYGGIVNDILEMAKTKDNLVVFEAENDSAEVNIKKFDKEINIKDILSNKKFLLCKINSREINDQEIVQKLGSHIIQKFYENNPTDCTLVIDEAHLFINKGIMNNLLQNKKNSINCILSNQEINKYSNDILDELLTSTEHLVCYNVDNETANLLAKQSQFEISAEQLTTLDKFHFYTKLQINGASPYPAATKGIVFPMPY